MRKRIVTTAVILLALLATSCEAALDAATDGINGDAQTGVGPNGETGADRVVGEAGSQSGVANALPAGTDLEVVTIENWVPHGNTTIDGSQIRVDASGPWPDGSRTARAASATAYSTSPGDQWHGAVTMSPGVAFRAELRFYDGNTIVDTVMTAPLVHSDDGPSIVSGTSPEGADTVRLRVFLASVDYGEAYDVVSATLLVEPGTEQPVGVPTMENWTPLGNTVVDGTVLAVDKAGPYADDSRTARAGTTPHSHASEGQKFRGSVVMADGVDFRAELRFFSGSRILGTVTSAPIISSDGHTASVVEGVAPAGTDGVILRVFLDDVDYGERHRILGANLDRVGGGTPSVTEPTPTPTPTAAPRTVVTTTTTAPPTTPVPSTTTAPPTTVPPTTAPPTTVPPTTTTAPSGGREVIDASSWTGTVVLDQANTIYDFGNVSAGRDITIAASNVEARNIRGSGARRVGQRDGRDYVDSGFRNFEFTYVATENGSGGKIVRPYFIGGTDVNPDGRIGVGSPVHIYAYGGDVVDPLLQDFVARGWKLDNSNPDPHNDAIHFTGINGGKVHNPTLRNVDVMTGAAHGVLMRHVWGTVTVEDSTFQRRYGAYFAFFGNAEDVSATVEVIWRNNTLPDDAPGSSAAAFRNGWTVNSSSDMSLGGGGIVVLD